MASKKWIVTTSNASESSRSFKIKLALLFPRQVLGIFFILIPYQTRFTFIVRNYMLDFKRKPLKGLHMYVNGQSSEWSKQWMVNAVNGQSNEWKPWKDFYNETAKWWPFSLSLITWYSFINVIQEAPSYTLSVEVIYWVTLSPAEPVLQL